MTREAFRELVKKGPVLLDGATGTNLQKAGMPVGVCPEQWILENSEVLIDLQKRYVEAGTDILFAPTFTASRIKLKEYGLEDHLEEMNRKLVALSKEAAKGTNALVAGDLTMTGEQLYPLGDLMFEDLVDVYKEQAKIIAEAGADLFVVETMMSLQECRAAVLAIREVCDLPVMVSLTYNEDGRTLYGTDPVTAVVVMQSLGADAVGMNCSTGPEAMLEPIAKMAEYAAIPLLAKPNAGMPELIDGQTVFNVEPEEFAEVGKKLVEEGAAIIGGCCGTTPEHIRALKEAVKGIPVKAPLQTKRRMLTSERKSVEITLDGRFMVIGERINPTGKKKLQAELKEGSLNLVRTMALEQEENGASILDINMGMNGIDEKEMMLRTIYEVTSTVDCPLCIDSSHVDIIEAALRIYPGRALINSISLEKEKFEKLLPIAKKYGAMFILLPLSDEGLPKDSAEKHGIIRTIMDEAVRIGMAKEDIIVDGLVATIGANPNAALECFETFSYCKNELELPTACGLSNISFGLPERTYVNTAFLTMAIANGLTMAIANPSQELLMNAAFASDMLLNKKESDIRYIERMNFLSEKYAGMERVMVQKTPAGTSAAGGEIRKESTGSGVFQAVLKGNKEHILEEVKKMLDGGAKPDEIINEHLIAAINEVGELFDKKKYFLPQLISSANTMKLAIEYLEPMLERSNTEAMATIVVATVEGDIHDIGKNLVVLMLKNYGYHVIDLGKDVPADVIVDTAMNEGAKVIGLSALMTTTMMRMKDVVELAKEKGCTAKIVIGGAAITESFSDEIGADGYSKDAAECVKLVERLLA
ncbi:homocysteine S-methyltransferase family protein [Roseburia intestinalis]|jgi:5-methyltetrahydrofolate--homocysteine methyltransferase|uniref:Methionine synthase n=1 Tax=Roseburia intestinalis TaxID=166486 RepID=A0A3R6KHD5_9FIRM|nr:homocysteine S-methyltransferase family protein [Roseburia intestinalis]RHG29248.1 5-methyltetrahydrofolate--homocysteine methyltransferase [Roseburia intestinalis]